MGQQREAFAAELRRLRACAGLSLAELGRTAHVNRGYVGHIEHGQRWPSRGWLTTVADFAQQTGHQELHAWRYESLLVNGHAAC
ncbi:MAG: helix-turn-helix transcriptional regulator [Actinomycetota bacterium]|nr:helix-turn-helix transcriptional regulator [Actinomycetota bacterium]